MLKVAFFQGEDERGLHVIPLFGPAERTFEKIAAPLLLPEVATYIAGLKPRKDAQYVLLNALGASEWWGANINADAFPEASLIHRPDEWTGNPLLDKIKSKDWAYGFPTFYFAHPYAHHRNKDSTRAFGEVELAAWNPRMKRVELVARIDEDKCHAFGGTGVWDKLKAGEYPDVSMGTKVPYDTCSICLDWKAYRDAQAMFKPGRDKSPGATVLRIHKELLKKNGKGIRGVSITRADYCDHMKHHANQILPDGRKVFVSNDYPQFFDISFVFIGADRTAKTMMKIAHAGRVWSLPSAELAEKLGYAEGNDVLLSEFELDGTSGTKTASAPGEELKLAFLGKQAKDKDAEITKDVVPSQFANKAVPLLTHNERDLPRDVLDALGTSSLEEALSTPSGLGIVLRPREFQRIILIQMGHRPLADKLESENKVFPKVDEGLPVPMGADFFSPLLASILAPFIASRSALGPPIERRVLVSPEVSKEKHAETSSLSSPLLRKIGAAYTAYRTSVMELVAHTQDLLSSMTPSSNEYVRKVASAPIESVFTPLSVCYLKQAFWDEVGSEVQDAAVERVLPSGITGAKMTVGGHR